eukprot:1456995-Amphidinium_carterae.1
MVSPTLCENVLAEAMFATYEERQEHRRCDNPRFRNGKLVVADPQHAQAELLRHVLTTTRLIGSASRAYEWSGCRRHG